MLRALASAVLLVVLAAGGAWAHSDGKMTYPYDCCGGMDCAPVDHVEIVAGATYFAGAAVTPIPPSVMIVTTKNGSVGVPQDFPYRQSTDARMHACMAPNGQGGNRLICLWMPPGGSGSV